MRTQRPADGARRITQMALLTAIALTIFMAEAQIPVPIPIPGIKLGLANIVTVYAVFALGPGDALLILVARVFLGAVFSGQMMTLFYSLGGGLLCWLLLLLLSRLLTWKQIWLCSPISAVFHNLGQLLVAAALLGFPRLLILDEPTNGLDPAGIQEMRELIRSLPGRFGMTVVVSSHLLSEIDQMADHVGIIREGRLVFQDTLSALHARSCPRLALRTTDNAGAARLLGENRVPCTLEDGWLTLPLLSDADAASLSRFLASHRVDLLRMEERQKSLEDLFLELTGREESL